MIDLDLFFRYPDQQGLNEIQKIMKKSYQKILMGLMGFAVLVSGQLATSHEAKTKKFYLLYTGNTFGELKPCGCAKEEDQGGIERRQAFFNDVKSLSHDILLVDTGDSFKEPTRQGKIKANFLMKSMVIMEYDAVAIGDKDLVYGQSFLRDYPSIPWLATNLKLKEIDSIPRFRIKKLGNGLKILLLAISGMDLFYTGPQTGLALERPFKFSQSFLNDLQKSENADLVVLLTHMEREKALKLLKIKKVDIVINGHINKETDVIDMTPVQEKNKIFLQSGPRGQKVGHVLVSLDADGNKTFDHKMVRLDSNIDIDPEMKTLYDDYNQKIEELFFETLSTRRKKNNKQVFATDSSCKQCHPKAHKIWKGSSHGQAYYTLHKVNKAFDPECLVCHTVGFNQQGGFISENDTPNLKNVQCEMCHGPGLDHINNPKSGWNISARQACKKCHVKNHSPKFNFAEYWPRIQHSKN